MTIREQIPGDIGWIVQIHAEVYSGEYGWDRTFEALVAEIGAKFIRNFVPGKECGWIAVAGGKRAGSVIVVRKTPEVAQLRLLIVDPLARGLGVGAALVAEAINFSRDAGYKKLALWTNRGLDAARHIYEKQGFVLVKEEPHHSFGKDLVGQFWDLDL